MTRLIEQVPSLAQAWTQTRGDGVVVAVVDEGIEVDHHPEFDGRVLPGWQSTGRDRAGWHPHGTKVAGLAVAGGMHVMGMAPHALLLPVNVPALAHGVGDRSEADGIRWAVDHGADVICCAWAPPRHDPRGGRLPERTRDALNHALTAGRGGKGCVVVFAAGNEGCDLDHNGYAAHPGVITVGACNHLGRRAAYSNWGSALTCVFPSNDPQDPVGRDLAYLTTMPPGSFERGQTWYSRSFGFTSASCAAVAGLCALIIAAAPNLTWAEVRDVLRESCERIDPLGGQYDAEGHSLLYGYGRPDPARAVALARARAS
ncbi:MAG TPA: S8 family serine peptidase [Gemmatimonadaceae bacterium]